MTPVSESKEGPDDIPKKSVWLANNSAWSYLELTEKRKEEFCWSEYEIPEHAVTESFQVWKF